jgi:hypothetical protein
MALPDELLNHVAAARQDRNGRQDQINAYLKFADPTRPRIGDDPANPTSRTSEADDLFDCTLQEVHEDFASDLLNRVMPRYSNWLSYEPADALSDEDARAIEEPLAARTTAIFDEVRRSTWYDEAAGEWAGDLGHGTGSFICNDLGRGRPLHMEAIPPGQLLIERGAWGGLCFKGRECAQPLEEAMAQWPDYDWPADMREALGDKTRKRRKVKLLEGAVRVYDPGYDEKWDWYVCADEKIIHKSAMEGRGSCPISVTRWRTNASTAWGAGPGLKCVADAKTLDQLRYLVLKNLGKVVDPPIAYDDDGLINPEGGVDAGMWIIRAQGSKIEPIETEGRLDLAYFEQAGLQDSVRRALYQYGPRQRGKTPPTLGQWYDEKSEEGRRLESPTGKIYAEGVIALLERVEYLMVKRGQIPELLDIGKTAVKVRPQNPLARQQDYEKVQASNQILASANASFGPQVIAAEVDAGATIRNMKRAMSDEIIVLREADAAMPLLQAALGAEQSAPPAAG